MTTTSAAAQTWNKPIDLLFIDGDHTYEGVRYDFESFRRWLTDNALVIFHDTKWEYHKYHKSLPSYREDIGVPRFMHEVQEAGYHSITLPPVPGLTVLSPKREGFEFCPTMLAIAET